MNPVKFVLTRLLRPVLKKVGMKFAGNTFADLLISGGIIGLSAFIYMENIRSYIIVADAMSSVLDAYTSQQDSNNFIVNVANKCKPSIVTIEIENSQYKNIYFDEDEIESMSAASGFVVKPNGWILTNAFSILRKPNSIINVKSTNDELFEATVTDIDLNFDLALLKVNCDNMQALKFGEDVALGEWVVAMGSPLSLKDTITAGVVSSVGRDAKELGFQNTPMKCIQTDASLHFGHSGGPLLNLNGDVIGVINMKIVSGSAFAIPFDYVNEFLARSCMLKHTKEAQNTIINSGFGITTLPTSHEVIQNLNEVHYMVIPEGTNGLVVWNVVEDSPAHKAGFKFGDIVTHINKKTTTSVADFYSLLSWHKNESVTFTIFRNGYLTVLHLNVKNKNKKK